MNFKFWKKRSPGEIEVANTRIINDLHIHVSRGLHGSRDVKVSAWNQPMVEDLFWKVWDGLEERERDG